MGVALLFCVAHGNHAGGSGCRCFNELAWAACVLAHSLAPPAAQVAAVGGSLAGYFGVFHRLMAAKLREAAAAPDERQLAALCRVLKEDCCASQHTYVHAQQVLGELGRHPHGARFRRMAQELEEHAAALHGPVVWKMRQWFVEPGALACAGLLWAVVVGLI